MLVDDYSRLLVHGRWMTEENTRAGQDVLRSAIARRGLPEILHVDNGAPYANHQLARACAVLGIALVHSKPYAPQGRGKQERLNSYIRASFIAEMEDRGIASFDELNDLFMAWAEQVANARAHAETKQAPIERFLESFTPDIPAPSSSGRSVPVVGHPSSHQDGHHQPAGQPIRGRPAQLIGRTVELRFDPEDLAKVDVFDNGVLAGAGHPVRDRPSRAPRRPPSRPRALRPVLPGSTTWAWWPPPTPRRWARARSPTGPCQEWSPGATVTTRRPADGRRRRLGCALRFLPHPFHQVGARRQALRASSATPRRSPASTTA